MTRSAPLSPSSQRISARAAGAARAQARPPAGAPKLEGAGARGFARRPRARLLGLAGAEAPHVLPQDLAARLAARAFKGRFADYDRLAKAFGSAGIERRGSVRPPEWFERPQGWPERAAAYDEGATDLFVAAAQAALADAGAPAEAVDTVVTVSSTGVAAPSLEARAMARMGFRDSVRRVPVFGLGCAGGVSGLSLAARLAAADPGAIVLLVCVETCTVNFRPDRAEKADVIAAALFGDGAAAAVLRADGADDGAGPAIVAGVERTWPDTLDVMGWRVDATGLGVVFDRAIPPFAAQRMGAAMEACLGEIGLPRAEIARFLFHPGGRKVLEALEAALALGDGALEHERAVLRAHGNMSAPTALFVLARALAQEPGPGAPFALAALGPGFTLSLLAVERGEAGA